MAKTIHIGSTGGFLLQLTLSNKPSENPGLIWGEGRLLIGGREMIASEAGNPVKWTWVDLLEWLAKNWAYLMCEQSFPFQVASLSISTLLRDLEKRWENMAEERVDEEEEEAYRFLNRHDLSSAFKGVFFPALYIMRQGALMEIFSAEHSTTLRLPFKQVTADLEQIADQLAQLANGTGQGRGELATQRWRARGQKLADRAVPLLTGLGSDSLAQINPQNSPVFWEHDPATPMEESELMAAARMTGGVLVEQEQAQILEMIRNIGSCSTDELDKLSEALAEDFKDIGKPYDQGYWAAIWLRRKLGLKEMDSICPAELLQNWGVQLQYFKMPESRLDALACWGTRHGPAILMNKAPENTPAHLHGENTTLAHEICHLLLDRHGALPVAEVLNGNTPERLEKRARAFAAEFLLPRSVAAKAVRKSKTLEAAVTELSDTYKVSTELVSWQVINSEVFTALSESEQRWLQRQSA